MTKLTGSGGSCGDRFNVSFGGLRFRRTVGISKHKSQHVCKLSILSILSIKYKIIFQCLAIESANLSLGAEHGLVQGLAGPEQQ